MTDITVPNATDDDPVNPNEPGSIRPHIAVAISGGGHRASLFGVGALLYLVDAGKGPEIATISSVSGGSITNGYVGLTTDLHQVSPSEFRQTMQTFTHQITSVGTVFASPLTIAYVLAVAIDIGAAIALTVILNATAAWVIWAVALLIGGWLAQQRSWIAARAFDRAIYHRAPLDAMGAGVTHILCAADLQTAEHVYFSGKFIYSYRTGWGQPARLRLASAVQASAALPGAFNPVTFPAKPHNFVRAPFKSFKAFKLVDGGVYDNMGTEWPTRLTRRLTSDPPPSPLALETADELLVINGSAAARPAPRRTLRTPLLGEITNLLAVKDVLYDQTTAVRRRLLDLRFRVTRRDPGSADGNLSGAPVQIDRSPYDLPDTFANYDDDIAQRARNCIRQLGDTPHQRATWADTAETSRKIKTALSKIDPDQASALIRHAYALTMTNCHVLLNYPLLPIPDHTTFRDLTT